MMPPAAAPPTAPTAVPERALGPSAQEIVESAVVHSPIRIMFVSLFFIIFFAKHRYICSRFSRIALWGETLRVWMAKDFDNAEEWYRDNWKNLPADKAQYAAASFAKQAIKTGDLDVAEQWLPYIQDPKTKERIQAEFSKAAGE